MNRNDMAIERVLVLDQRGAEGYDWTNADEVLRPGAAGVFFTPLGKALNFLYIYPDDSHAIMSMWMGGESGSKLGTLFINANTVPADELALISEGHAGVRVDGGPVGVAQWAAFLAGVETTHLWNIGIGRHDV